MFGLAEEEVLLWNPGVGPWPFSQEVATDQVIYAQCEEMVMARLETPIEVENDQVELNPEAHPPEGLYIARILVRDRWEVPMRVLNATHHE
jgi:hypothetical protein